MSREGEGGGLNLMSPPVYTEAMIRIAAIGLLLFLLAPYRVLGADPYPSLYRGIAREEGPRFLAHFSPSFLSKSPGAQERFFSEVEEGIESLGTLKKSDPRISEPKSLDLLVEDRPGDLYQVVVGIRFYQARARSLRVAERPVRCGNRLTVEVDADWVMPSPPLEKEDPPPFLEANADPDGPLIFKGSRFNPIIDEFHQTKFQRIRFPEDLPEGLRSKFGEETAPAKTEPPSPPVVLYAPLIGFLPIEAALWRSDLPEKEILLFFYRRKGEWNEVPFSLTQVPARPFSGRVISRFDLNRNGKMEYLVEARDDQQSRRMIYELDETRNAATLMTVAEDSVVIPDTRDPRCRGGGTLPPLPKESPLPPASPPPGHEGP
jgi:hypothetical protein